MSETPDIPQAEPVVDEATFWLALKRHGLTEEAEELIDAGFSLKDTWEKVMPRFALPLQAPKKITAPVQQQFEEPERDIKDVLRLIRDERRRGYNRTVKNLNF